MPFVTCPKQGREMEAVVLRRIGFLAYSCPKQGLDFKPLAAPLHPTMCQVPRIKESDTRNQITHYCGVGVTYHPEKSKQSRLEKVIEYAIRRRTEMVAEKSGPSFASILIILSIVMYTGGFLRIELEFNKQKDKINQLESVVESMKTSKGDDIAQGKLV